MLVQFRVENHRSLRDEQTLSMVASGGDADPRLIHPEGLGEALLPVVALYGANASGKTNVLQALAFSVNRNNMSDRPVVALAESRHVDAVLAALADGLRRRR